MEILLDISDKAFKRISAAYCVRQMSGESFGITEELIGKIIAAVENGQSTVSIKLKQEGNNNEQ